jgi:hypothetical protein
VRKIFVAGTVSATVLFGASPAQAAGVDLSPLIGGLTRLLSPTSQQPKPEDAPSPMLPELPQVPELAVESISETLNVVLVGPERQVLSTAYCLTGRMASGKPVYDGAAAMNGVPLGSKFKVLDGPRSGEVLTVEDRLPKRGGFDIAYPGKCGQAAQYGRRSIRISQAEVLPAPSGN